MKLRVLFASLILVAGATTPLAAQINGTTHTSCNGDTGSCSQQTCQTDKNGNSACTTVTLKPPPLPAAPTKREFLQLACEERERERQWVAYCKPEIHVDHDGIGRYRYAAKGCNLGASSANSSQAAWLTEAFEEKCRLEAFKD